MKFVFLGTAGYHPNEQRHTAGLFAPEHGLLLDAGTGTFRLARFLQCDELTILLSHAHLDHIVGLTYLLPHLNSGRLKRIRIVGRPEVLRAIDTHLFADSVFPVRVPAESVAIDDRPIGLTLPGPDGAPIAVTVIPVTLSRHRGGSTAFRLDTPSGSLAYVTDTAPDETYIDAIRGVDVLVHECNFPDAQRDWAEQTGHCYLSHVLHVTDRAGVRRLYLTHLDPTLTGTDPLGLQASPAAVRLRESGTAIHVAEDLAEIALGE